MTCSFTGYPTFSPAFTDSTPAVVITMWNVSCRLAYLNALFPADEIIWEGCRIFRSFLTWENGSMGMSLVIDIQALFLFNFLFLTPARVSFLAWQTTFPGLYVRINIPLSYLPFCGILAHKNEKNNYYRYWDLGLYQLISQTWALKKTYAL